MGVHFVSNRSQLCDRCPPFAPDQRAATRSRTRHGHTWRPSTEPCPPPQPTAVAGSLPRSVIRDRESLGGYTHGVLAARRAPTTGDRFIGGGLGWNIHGLGPRFWSRRIEGLLLRRGMDAARESGTEHRLQRFLPAPCRYVFYVLLCVCLSMLYEISAV